MPVRMMRRIKRLLSGHDATANRNGGTRRAVMGGGLTCASGVLTQSTWSATDEMKKVGGENSGSFRRYPAIRHDPFQPHRRKQCRARITNAVRHTRNIHGRNTMMFCPPPHASGLGNRPFE